MVRILIRAVWPDERVDVVDPLAALGVRKRLSKIFAHARARPGHVARSVQSHVAARQIAHAQRTSRLIRHLQAGTIVQHLPADRSQIQATVLPRSLDQRGEPGRSVILTPRSDLGLLKHSAIQLQLRQRHVHPPQPGRLGAQPDRRVVAIGPGGHALLHTRASLTVHIDRHTATRLEHRSQAIGLIHQQPTVANQLLATAVPVARLTDIEEGPAVSQHTDLEGPPAVLHVPLGNERYFLAWRAQRLHYQP